MKAIITNILKDDSGEQITALLTDYGTLIGDWDGPIPEPSSTVYVELEFTPERVAEVSGTNSYLACSPFPKEVQLVGLAESWRDGVLDLRVGDSLVQVEWMEEPSSGSWLSITGHALRFFDTNL